MNGDVLVSFGMPDGQHLPQTSKQRKRERPNLSFADLSPMGTPDRLDLQPTRLRSIAERDLLAGRETAVSVDNPSVATQARSLKQEDSGGKDLWIFREGKQSVSTRELIAEIRRRVNGGLHQTSAVVDGLIAAGQLESALADANSPCAGAAAEVTNELASALCRHPGNSIVEKAENLENLEVPARVSISPPEGFTYYALHPSDFATVLDNVPLEARRCAVVGIRSIGTTLSAVVLAALNTQGRTATRITVRPTGHPYSRKTEFSPEQLHWIFENLGAHFLVVDEGPGRSGSTFLSVAEALLRAGVPRKNLTLIGSREPDVAGLCAIDAASRWPEFRFIAASSSAAQRFEGYTYVGGGDWRRFLLPPGHSWPPCWTQMERLKFLCPDWKHLFKFEGMGRAARPTHVHAFALAETGFGPAVQDAGGGFLRYSLVSGNQMRPSDADTPLLNRIAEYCAFRFFEFAAPPADSSNQLGEMLEFNVGEEFGIAVSLPDDVFSSQRPVYTDSRMQSYEWIAEDSGSFIKIDGAHHGDNHFFPGPCDITWDLAGASVEWQMGKDATEYLISRFRKLTDTDPSGKFMAYRLAYLVFRLGFCKMALSTVKGSSEEQRLRVNHESYCQQAKTLLACLPGGKPDLL